MHAPLPSGEDGGSKRKEAPNEGPRFKRGDFGMPCVREGQRPLAFLFIKVSVLGDATGAQPPCQDGVCYTHILREAKIAVSLMDQICSPADRFATIILC